MSWWQKKILRYALNRIGVLDDESVQLDNLDIAFGRRNVVELRNVGLKRDRIRALVNLPPETSIDVARIRLLRLTVPADIYKSAIVAEADGIELAIRVDQPAGPQTGSSEAHGQVSSRRGVNLDEAHEQGGGQIPSTQELARSFLLEGSPTERRQLEAAMVKETSDMVESFRSESTESDDVGTGAAVGLPGFLAGFLQAIVDRLQISIKDINFNLFYASALHGSDAIGIRVVVKEVTVGSVADSNDPQRDGKRSIEVCNVSVDLLGGNPEVRDVTQLNDPTSGGSPSVVSSPNDNGQAEKVVPRSASPIVASASHPTDIDAVDYVRQNILGLQSLSEVPMTSGQSSRVESTADEVDPDYGIKAGDDNISWVSRQSSRSAEGERLWDETSADDDLRQSIAFGPSVGLQASSTRAASPVLPRQRRSVSPYERTLQHTHSLPVSPEDQSKSWPVPDTSSWPAIPSRRRNPFHNAQPSSPTSLPRMTSSNNPEPENLNDMTTSVSSDNDEPSMYFSIMSERNHVPNDGEGSRAPTGSSMQHIGRSPGSSEAFVAPTVPTIDESRFDNLTPRPASPNSHQNESDTFQNSPYARNKPILTIDRIVVSIPSSASLNSQEGHGGQDTTSQSYATSPRSAHVPGSFASSYDISISSTTSRMEDSSQYRSYTTQDSQQSNTSPLEIITSIGKVKGQLDPASCKTLIVLFSAFSHLSQDPRAASQSGSRSAHTTQSSNAIQIAASVQDFRIDIADSHQEGLLPEGRPLSALVSLVISDASFTSRSDSHDLRLGHMALCLADTELLSFKQSPAQLTPSLTTRDLSAIHVTIKSEQSKLGGGQITEVHCETRPICLVLELRTIDEMLPFFATLIKLQDIIPPSIGYRPKTSPSVPPSKGVRFQDVKMESARNNDELKINVRINGVHVLLVGRTARVDLNASTIKAVYRMNGAKATVERVSVVGPYLESSTASPPLEILLSTIRIDHSTTPRDQDLERLLLLLTPSKDKYDNDDDILLETLLRQRRQGAVGRVLIAQVDIKCTDLNIASLLTGLGDEMAKFAAVTKYLPEDDRPGLLSLVKIDRLKAQVHANEQLGSVELVADNIDLAQVGLPAMLAFGITEIHLRQIGQPDIIRPLIPSGTGEMLPMMMARMLGEDESPTIKVKIYNTCLEYSVPLVVALASLTIDDSEDVFAALTESLADLSLLKVEPRTNTSQQSKPKTGKATKLVLLLHDSALGLSPQKIPSKAFVILTDAKCTISIPAEENFSIETELRKASLWLTDQRDQEAADASLRIPNNTATSLKVAAHVGQRGYVPMASILSARIAVNFTAKDELESSRFIEVHVENELMLLETCADSTQTLFATLGDLAPPSAPSKQPRYHMDPMTIEDMLASFSGDAFPQASDDQISSAVLFDADYPAPHNLEESDDDFLSEAITRGDLDLDMSEPSSSMYESSLPNLTADDQRDDESESWPATAASLLEEDPFVMTVFEDDSPLSSHALLRELQKQCHVPFNRSDKEIQIAEDSNSVAQLSHSTPRLPLVLKVRDVHLIWNMHDGYDWQHTRDGISNAVDNVEARLEERLARHRRSPQDYGEEDPVITDFLFNSIYIGVSPNHDPQNLRRQINKDIDDLASENESASLSGTSRFTATTSRTGHGPRQSARKRRLQLERSRKHKVAFEVRGLSADVRAFPPDSGDIVHSIDVRVRNFEIFDNVPTSTWRKFLTPMDVLREVGKPMIHLEIDNIRTLKDFAAAELTIHATLLPLRLHVDQDALDFITRFFAFKDPRIQVETNPNEQPFLQRVEVETVDLRLDYKPKRIDYGGLRSGHTTEFMNFITLEGTNIRLKHAIVYGLRGFDPLHKTLNDVWMPDVRDNQLPTVLAGLAPVRGIVNIGSGIRDIVAIPIQEYRKDGRIVRSIRKGAVEFGKTTASELARLGAKVAVGTQNLLEGAEGLLTPVGVTDAHTSSDTIEEEASDEGEKRLISAYAEQPLGVLSGLQSARRRLEYDLVTARDALIAVQGEILDSSSPAAMAVAVARHAPTVILRPVIGATRAVSTTLMGVGNQIDRDNARRMEDKYKRR